VRDCSKHVIAAGIARIVTLPPKAVPKWHEDARLARGMLEEARIEFVQITLPEMAR
jgi:deoxycytidylate deaminase